MKRSLAFGYYWLPVLLWMAVILTLSAQSEVPRRNDPSTGAPIPQTFALAKMVHVFEYGVLSLLVFRAVRAPSPGISLSPGRALGASVAVCLAFGALDEFRQSFVPGREPSGWDVLIDGLAAFVGGALVLAWLRLANPRMSSA